LHGQNKSTSESAVKVAGAGWHLRNLLASVPLGLLTVNKIEPLGLAQLVDLATYLHGTDIVGCLGVPSAMQARRIWSATDSLQHCSVPNTMHIHLASSAAARNMPNHVPNPLARSAAAEQARNSTYIIIAQKGAKICRSGVPGPQAAPLPAGGLQACPPPGDAGSKIGASTR